MTNLSGARAATDLGKTARAADGRRRGILTMLIALVVYLIVDLDRPRRGAIQVSHESMTRLQQTIKTILGDTAQPDSPPGAPHLPRQ